MMLITLLAVAAVAASPARSAPAISMDKEKELCLTPACIKTAADILNNMDSSVNPCDDFHKFACGGWLNRRALPEDKVQLNAFALANDEVERKLRKLLERAASPSDEPIVKSIKSIYSACMNTTHIESQDPLPLVALIKKLGGWPVFGELSGWSDARPFDWVEMLIKFRDLGLLPAILVGVSLGVDLKNSSNYMLDVDQPTLGVPLREYLVGPIAENYIPGYFNFMMSTIVYLGADPDKAKVEMRSVLELERQIANFSSDIGSRREMGAVSNQMNLTELSKLVPNVDWRRLLSKMSRKSLGPDEKINVLEPSYLRSLNKLLVETDDRTLANYLMWRVALQVMPAMSERWLKLDAQYGTSLFGMSAKTARWRQCLALLRGPFRTFDVALSSLYVREHVEPESKEKAQEMVRYLRQELVRLIAEVDWMDEATRAEASAKALLMKSYAGYPEELVEGAHVGEHYRSFELPEGEYLDMVLYLNKWSMDRESGRFCRGKCQDDWTRHANAANVNAFYMAAENEVELPAGVLQGAFFSSDRPSYLNFGAIGYIIGHEMTHGFDDLGRQFDRDGNSRNWWREETAAKFRDRAQCIIDQYANYTTLDGELRVNGALTQGENIADNGGLKEAFRAYESWLRDHQDEPLLPGLELNQRQLFWVSAANLWCETVRPETARVLILSDTHSPAELRIIGPMSNLEEFSESFNCPLGSPMNPVKKCTVW